MSEGKSAGEKGLEKATEAVPTLFYDLIARIISGCALIIAVSWNESSFKNVVEGASWGSGLLFMMGGYVVGMLLTTFAFVLDFAWAKCGKPAMNAANRFLNRKYRHTRLDEVSANIDSISFLNSALGHNLFKMLAEVTLFENLLSGVLIFGIYRCVWISSVGWWKELVFGFVVLLALVVRICALVIREQICSEKLGLTLESSQESRALPPPAVLGIAREYGNLGLLRMNQERYVEAEEKHSIALEIFTTICGEEDKARINLILGVAAKKKDRNDEARKFWKDARDHYLKSEMQGRVAEIDALLKTLPTETST